MGAEVLEEPGGVVVVVEEVEVTLFFRGHVVDAKLGGRASDRVGPHCVTLTMQRSC